MDYKAIVIYVVALLLTAISAGAVSRNSPEKWAIMFVDQDLKVESSGSLIERVSMSIPMSKDRVEYLAKGYKVFVAYAEEETIIRAILDERVKSISYYGHGGGTIPQFGDRNAASWKQEIFKHLLKQYRSAGYSQKKAYDLADAQSQNFGFKDVINRSCGSLYDESLADLFVAPGNTYYGVRAERYYPCNPLTALFSTSDWTLDEHTIQKGAISLGNKFILKEGGTSGTCTCEGGQWKCKFSSGTVSTLSNISITGNKITMTRKDVGGYNAIAKYEGTINGNNMTGKRFWKPKNGKGHWGKWSATIVN